MDIQKLNDLRHRIMTGVEKEFNEDLVAAKLTERDENGVEALAVVLDDMTEEGFDATGEFFFLPSAEDEDLQFFVNLITLVDKIPNENLSELLTATACINTYVMTGCFAVDAGAGSLVYKLTYEMPIDVDEKTMKKNVDMTMGTALQVVRDNAYLLTEVCYGKRNAQSVINLFLNRL